MLRELNPWRRQFGFLCLHDGFVTLEVITYGEKSEGFIWVLKPL